MVKHTGYLSKRGFFYGTWHVRFFVLSDASLQYYTDATKSDQKGEYVLDNETQLGPCADMGPNPFCIRIVTGSREIFLSSANDRDRQTWIEMISAAVRKLKSQGRSSTALTGASSAAVTRVEDEREAARQDLVKRNSILATVADTVLTNLEYGDEGDNEGQGHAAKFGPDSNFDERRRSLYSTERVPGDFLSTATRMSEGLPDLHFSDHALGAVPPFALYNASKRVFGMYHGLVNGMWDCLFGQDVPMACGHLKHLLGYPEDSQEVMVELAHNTHQIVSAIFSTQFDRLMGETCDRPLRILTSTDEFYSVTRQLNRFMEAKSPRIVVESVSAEPIETFAERALEYVRANASAGRQYDFIYFSHVSFLQRTLLPDLRGFVGTLRSHLADGKNPDTVVIIDGYHSFGAFPVDLNGLDCIFLVGILKHVGCGANLCMALIPKKYTYFRPFITGWLSDLSVLAPDHDGIRLGSAVGYMPGLTTMGSTPSFNLPVVTFNFVMNAWKECGIDVGKIHQHVMGLHKRFLDGMDALKAQGKGNPFICKERLLSLQDEAYRSHTLVFVQDSATVSKYLVEHVKTFNITIDSRKVYVRVGFGLNHNDEDVDRLIRSLEWSADKIVPQEGDGKKSIGFA